MTYQTRYAEFARIKGFTPGNEPLMHEYISWIKGKWSQWRAQSGCASRYLTPEDHAAFDAWLAKESA